jgi:ribosome-associated toxin RatA of RatAB toxin-antitoxin module
MAESTTGSVQIDATPEQVARAVADVASYPDWAEGVKRVEVLDTDPAGRPLRARFDVASGFVNGWYVVDYDWSADGTIAWTLAESPLLKRMEGSYVLRSEGAGTLATYTLALEPSIPLIGPLRRKAEQQLVTTALDDLARYVGGAP